MEQGVIYVLKTWQTDGELANQSNSNEWINKHIK